MWILNWYREGGSGSGATTIILTNEVDMQAEVNQIEIELQVQPKIIGVDFEVEVNQIEINLDIKCEQN